MKPLILLPKRLIIALMLLITVGYGATAQAQEPDLKFEHVFDLGSPGGQTMIYYTYAPTASKKPSPI